ncbi:glycoside hydrolase family 3 C-terminal domain-containing protein [Streptoverticillium reticulum]|uniref:glycoside hydrolase family 3 C-terminal domain-containing protein n=1 Tax=Streptoverticillium reticulum TaxID=1433415 RepID=UPI0039BFC2AA
MEMSRRLAVKLAGAAVVAVRAGAVALPAPAHPPHAGDQARRKAEDLVRRMTLDEKIAQLHGTGPQLPGTGYNGSIPGNPRLGIPALYLADGASGVGNGATGVTQWPGAKALAAAWDPELARRYGAAHGAEQAGKGHNVALAPCVNILRVPNWGRSSEAFTEDPHLNSRLAAAVVRGIQSQYVIATVKHFAANNQETDRLSIDVVVSRRALHEIYFPAFRAAVKEGGAAAVMTAYNKIDGSHASENAYTVGHVLRGEWGFDGMVMSDWGGTHSTAAAAKAGSDVEMPGGMYFGAALKNAVRSGEVAGSVLDGMVADVLTAMFRAGLFDHRLPDPHSVLRTVVSSREHLALARSISVQGSVLLKNQGVLPFTGAVRSVAVIGEAAHRVPQPAYGSATVTPSGTPITPLAGIEARAGTVKVLSSHHLLGRTADAAAVAAKADRAVVFVADTSGEGTDRGTLALPAGQNELIDAVAAANPNTVVVLNTSGAVLMPWLDKVRGVIANWYAGQEQGAAIAALLFGDAEPGGRLPETFPATDRQGPAGSGDRYPGNGVSVPYDEGLAVGYRWYHRSGQKPLFPFGFGLSYTRFTLADLGLQAGTDGSAQVRVTVRNTGSRTGSEVVQLYVEHPDAAGEPSPVLKAFAKATLAPGVTRTVELPLPRDAFAIWSEERQGWTVLPGRYRIHVGRSSADLPLSAEIRVP